MKLFSTFAFFALAAAQTERGKSEGDIKGVQSCQGVQISQTDFKCKNKKKKGIDRKRCRTVCPGANVKKVYCNDDGWGKKHGEKVNPNKIC
jgi:hypothetical protein